GSSPRGPDCPRRRTSSCRGTGSRPGRRCVLAVGRCSCVALLAGAAGTVDVDGGCDLVELLEVLGGQCDVGDEVTALDGSGLRDVAAEGLERDGLGLGAAALAGVQAIDGDDLVGGQLEVEDVDVLGDALGFDGL